jgi:hypothetical protein
MDGLTLDVSVIVMAGFTVWVTVLEVLVAQLPSAL